MAQNLITPALTVLVLFIGLGVDWGGTRSTLDALALSTASHYKADGHQSMLIKAKALELEYKHIKEDLQEIKVIVASNREDLGQLSSYVNRVSGAKTGIARSR